MCPSYLFSGVGTYAILVSGLCSLHCLITGSHSYANIRDKIDVGAFVPSIISSQVDQ